MQSVVMVTLFLMFFCRFYKDIELIYYREKTPIAPIAINSFSGNIMAKSTVKKYSKIVCIMSTFSAVPQSKGELLLVGSLCREVPPLNGTGI